MPIEVVQLCNFEVVGSPDVFRLIGFGMEVIGLSALAEGPMDLRSSVRPCVTRYLEIRASDFDDFLHKATS